MITGSASVRSIDWTETVGDDQINTADVVIVCDCVYYEASLQPLHSFNVVTRHFVSSATDPLSNSNQHILIQIKFTQNMTSF